MPINLTGYSIASIVDETLLWLGQYGQHVDGGITRLLYSESWMEAQKALQTKMEDWGLTAYYDHVGNLFGRLPGTNQQSRTILTGSHVDTVRNGGRFDGAYGIIAGMIALRILKEKYGAPLYNLEVVSFCEEEGSRFPITYWGSGNITGSLSHESAIGIQDSDGIGLLEAMNHAGFGSESALKSVARTDITSFIELHIEQGGVLEAERKSIGIVEQMVGQKRYRIEVTGEANHAGTTPMHLRKDALMGANRMIHRVFAEVESFGSPLVATIGRMILEPNIPNVIPSNVMFTLDVRHPNTEQLDEFCSSIIQIMEDIADQANLGCTVHLWLEESAVRMDPYLIQQVENICIDRGTSYKRMSSGAGHDAKLFVPTCPTAIVFVPSRGGISHSPREYTDPVHLQAGVEILVSILYQLGYNAEPSMQ